MEATAQVGHTGTKLKLDHDRQFEGRPGDSTLRIHGESPEGATVLDATYVEVSPDEAKLVGWFLRALRTPQTEITDEIAQELQATFSSCLTGRDAHQAAELAWNGITRGFRGKMGSSWSHERTEQLAERFERAAGRGMHPVGTGIGGYTDN